MLRKLIQRQWWSCSKRGFSTIPVVDISPFVDPNDSDPTAQQSAADQLHQACCDIGFVYLRGHGIPQEVLDQSRDMARQFFQLPQHIKQQISIEKSTSFRGYQSLGQNITRKVVDMHEGLDFYREYPDDHIFVKSKAPLIGPNQWPNKEDVPGFRETMDSYTSHMLHLGHGVMRAISLGLKIDESYFASYYSDPHWVMRLIGYPPACDNESATALGCGEHTDYGWLTFVNQDNIPNTLQVKASTGEWIPADSKEGCIVMNIGDMLNVWTNGLYKATPHRVLSSQGNVPRISTPFFFEPNYDAIISPLGSSNQSNENSVKYADHLLEKALNNFKLQ